MKQIFFLVFAAFALISCNNVLTYQMEVLRPANFKLPLDQNSFLLVNHSGIQPSSFGHISRGLPPLETTKDLNFNTAPLSDLVLESVSKYILNTGLINNIQIYKRADNKFRKNGGWDFLDSKKLTSLQVKELSDSSNADVLVSLDGLLVQSKTNEMLYLSLFKATRDVLVNTSWSVFDIKADSLLYQFQYSDSLYWEGYDGRNSATAQLPLIDKVLPEIGDVLGEKISEIFSPHWESVTRPCYYTGSIRMKLAADCVRRNDLDGAAVYWEDEFSKGFGRSVYRAAINMMFYAELSNDPVKTTEWIGKADGAMSKSLFGVKKYDRWLFSEWKNYIQSRFAQFKRP